MTECERCNDTHTMVIRSRMGDERRVPCTFCPVPCDHCRGRLSAYCKKAPCDCTCHVPRSREDVLTDVEREVLALLVEECAEVIQAVSKISRFGKYGRASRDDPQWGEGNLAALHKELADLEVVHELLRRAKLVNAARVETHVMRKMDRIGAFLGPARKLVEP